MPKQGELISGADAAKNIRIDPENLPLELPRRTRGTAGLLDIAAAVGAAPLRGLTESFGLVPGVEALHQAVATGDADIIMLILESTSSGRSRAALRGPRDDGC